MWLVFSGVIVIGLQLWLAPANVTIIVHPQFPSYFATVLSGDRIGSHLIVVRGRNYILVPPTVVHYMISF